MTQVEELIEWFQARPAGATLNEILNSGKRWSHEFNARKTDARHKGFDIELVERNPKSPSLNRYRLKDPVPAQQIPVRIEDSGQLVMVI